MLTGAQMLCALLEEQGVEVVFGYPGGAIMPLYHALPEFPRIRHVLVRHEQAAAHAADGYARASGRPGVCMATSGPGATNLVTGLATAQLDSSPVVAITGQVPRAMIGRDAFQETDIIGITLPLTKHSVGVRDISELPEKVREAFAIATEGRPGPVLIDIPKDVQNQRATWRPASIPAGGRSGASPVPTAASDDIGTAVRLIAEADRPLLLCGRGVILSGAYAEVRALAEKTGMPVISTLLGISAIPESHPQYLGMLGMHGEVHVNRAIQQADLLVAIGLRFDDRVTGNTAGFAPRARVIHIDLDAAEIGKNVPVEVALVGDARTMTGRLLGAVASRECDAWREEIDVHRRSRHHQYRGDMAPETILAAIREASGPECTIVSDVGQHQMWVAKLYSYEEPNSHITSGGLGTMGFAVPAAMGVHFARPGRPVWAISGDGGFQMNMQEIATMVQEGLPVKMAIFNNGYLGMVRQWQEFFHGRRYSATPIWSPDFVKLAEAYGVAGFRVDQAGQIEAAVAGAVREPGPALVEFKIEQEANVFPMIPPGGSLSEPIEAVPAGVPTP
jgi:acetolactate synthase-1/2/3 large subunit